MRRRSVRIKLAALCTAGFLFQGTQCSLTGEDVATLLIQNVASVLITGFVNDQLGATPTFGGF